MKNYLFNVNMPWTLWKKSNNNNEPKFYAENYFKVSYYTVTLLLFAETYSDKIREYEAP